MAQEGLSLGVLAKKDYNPIYDYYINYRNCVGRLVCSSL